VVEPLGSEILLDVRAGSSATTIVARVEPTVRAKVKDPEALRRRSDAEGARDRALGVHPRPRGAWAAMLARKEELKAQS